MEFWRIADGEPRFLHCYWPQHVLHRPTSGCLYWGWHLTASPRSHLRLCPLWPPGNTHTSWILKMLCKLISCWYSHGVCACVCVGVCARESAYHDSICVAVFSVVKGQMSSIVENQLQSLWCPCCSQHLETQSACQLACCHTNLNTHTSNPDLEPYYVYI